MLSNAQNEGQLAGRYYNASAVRMLVLLTALSSRIARCKNAVASKSEKQFVDPRFERPNFEGKR